MRLFALILSLVLTGCSAQAPSATSKSAPAEDSSYESAVQELAQLNRDASQALQSKKLDEAAAAITKGQPLMTRLLAVPRPTLAAVEASSDLEQLYGTMLLANRHYGWSRMLFQKNLARWTNWQPQTAETARRKKLAEDGIAACDAGMLK